MKTERHLKNNTELEKRIEKVLDKHGHINGQLRYPVGKMNFGHVNAGFASCELVAVYNVLRDAERHVPLSKIIYDAEKHGFLFAWGFFGTKISKIGKILEMYGVKYEKIKISEFKRCGKNNLFADGDTFIATIKNHASLPICGLHTFEMVFSGGKWTVYNRFSDDNHPSVYSDIFEILKNGREKGSYYSVYRILL